MDARSRVPHVILLDKVAELFAVVVVDLRQDTLILLDDIIVELDSLLTFGLLLLLLGVRLLLLLDLEAAGLLVTS